MLPYLLLMNRLKSNRREELQVGNPECCRTCLGSENLSDIFQSKNIMIKRMQQLKLTTGLRIKYNDGLSQKICSQCLDMMETALKFRQISLESQEALLDMKHYKESDENRLKIKIERDNDFQEVEIEFAKKSMHRQTTNLCQNKNLRLKMVKVKKKVRKKRKSMQIPNADSYTCPVCQMVFTIKSSFAQHVRYHYNPYVCELCGKRCRSISTLEAHKRAKHGLEKIYKCDQCEKEFAYREAYQIHVRTHTGEKPYICDICGAGFHRRGTFVQHLGVHNPENTVQCDLCPTRVKSLQFLYSHKNRVHSGKRYRYICPICDRRFDLPTKVKKHALEEHQVGDKDLGTIVRINTFLQNTSQKRLSDSGTND
ncbi:unnamed protein product [Pieris macdunnoughi]|uniref:Zinc finger protein n=1 Tax=Pieris macdunnoughi TaxID=345717 RepID=A0A821ULG7_9NEOP|nr:unnamed protein product [Pieris macdunnoughi]